MEDQQQKAKRYSKIKEYIELISIPLEIIFLFLMIYFFSDDLALFSSRLTDYRYIKIAVYGGMFLLAHTLFSLPLGFYSGYIIEHKFKLSTENILGWLKFQLKSLLFSLILGIPLLILFYLLLDNFPKIWWFIIAIVSFAITLIMSYILPFIIPFFYKLKPLDIPELKSKIRHIIEQAGLTLEGVYKIALGQRTKKANAALAGMGQTKRVLLSDTLFGRKSDEFCPLESESVSERNSKEENDSFSGFSWDEIASITAHEVGHYVHRHMWKMIFLEASLSFGLFFIIYMIIDDMIRFFSYGAVNDIINLPVILLTFTILNLFTTPLSNFFSRAFEYQADSYAVKASGKKDFISSLNKLARLNLTDKNPPKILEVLFHSHPSIEHRVEGVAHCLK